MELNGKTVLVCNCEGTMSLDGKALAKACGGTGALMVNSQLCRAQTDNFRTALAGAKPLIVACTQEAPLFEEVHAEAKSESEIAYVNIRERAGWSSQGDRAVPKIAALLAEAGVAVPPTPSLGLRSEGTCLVYGRDEVALAAAKRLKGRLDVTVLLTRPEAVAPPRVNDVALFKGTIVAAKGHLGAFEIVVDDYAPAMPSARERLTFMAPRNGAVSKCDLILDLSGGAPLFAGGDRRDGYFRPDPKNPAAVERALFDLADCVGEFEKPRYVDFNAALCVHSRSRKTGCTRCLDVCPASAIAPNGDAVRIDAFACGGCGACHSVCPTGAASYVMPPANVLFDRLRMLLSTYYRAGGSQAVLLAHDGRYGDDMIAALARNGRGLPANVLPFVLNEITQIGFDFFATALAYGAAQIQILVPPAKRAEIAGLAGQIGMIEALMSGLGFGSGRVGVIVATDPDAVEAALYDLPVMTAPKPATYMPVGDKRAVARLAMTELRRAAPAPVDIVPLPAGAAFGAIKVEIDGCTLCLACVGACPTGALLDNPDKPQLRFLEEACVQCGLCKNTCPEKVIMLDSRFNFTEAAKRALVVKEEAPFECINCGKPFGTKGAIERVMAQLAGKHSMFQNERMIRTIQMCNDCRVTSQFDDKAVPMAAAARPNPRTTDDYIAERDAAAKPKN